MAHVCETCGHASGKWFGRCPSCGAWNSAAAGTTPQLDIVPLSQSGSVAPRLRSGIAEVDRVLGGGFVAGEVVLLAGEPGIGKSTLVLQLMHSFVTAGGSALLVTGEESLAQVSLRAQRLQLDAGALRAAASTSVQQIVESCRRQRPELLVVDSIQTLADDDVDQTAGSVTQVRSCAQKLIDVAKSSGAVVLLVGHVTKDGAVAGPKTLEHAVDAVATLEGERTGTIRLLRSVKNRFGSCDETGVFAMTGRGLEAVDDPSAMFLSDRRDGVGGSAVHCSMQGTRPMLTEVQALVVDSPLSIPRRVAIGVDARRLDLLIGVLSKHSDVRLEKRDVFVSAAGGLSVKEPAADLALCAALMSASDQRPLDPDVVVLGEVGLGGEVRRVPALSRRLAEIRRMGFGRAVVPRHDDRIDDIDAVVVRDVRDLERAFARAVVRAV